MRKSHAHPSSGYEAIHGSASLSALLQALSCTSATGKHRALTGRAACLHAALAPTLQLVTDPPARNPRRWQASCFRCRLASGS